MKSIIFFFLFLSIAQAAPDSTKDICTSNLSTISERMKLNFEPNYFAKLFATKNYATVITDAKTYAVNLASGKMTNMEGTYDPVPTPDENFLVTIQYKDPSLGDNGPLYFQTDILDQTPPANGGFDRWAASDNYNTAYAYQSLGWLKSAKTGPYTYRFLCDDDQGQVYFRDDYFKGAAGEKDIAKYNINVGTWVATCTNIKSLLKLPMISKDGTHCLSILQPGSWA